MRQRYPVLQSTGPLVLVLGVLGLLIAAETAGPSDRPNAPSSGVKAKVASSRAFTTQTVRGKVVWLDEGLKRLYGVTTEPDAAKSAVALETSDGQLMPIVADTRGRAFMVDPRLREVDLELLVRRYAGVPMIQVIRVFQTKPDGKYEIDYWCDVCAISMTILKPCECCQGPTRLRLERVEAPGAAAR
jgi:hypothetical protein